MMGSPDPLPCVSRLILALVMIYQCGWAAPDDPVAKAKLAADIQRNYGVTPRSSSSLAELGDLQARLSTANYINRTYRKQIDYSLYTLDQLQGILTKAREEAIREKNLQRNAAQDYAALEQHQKQYQEERQAAAVRAQQQAIMEEQDEAARRGVSIGELRTQRTVEQQLTTADAVKKYWYQELMPGGSLRLKLRGMYPNVARNLIQDGRFDLDAEAAALSWNSKVYEKNGYKEDAQLTLIKLQTVLQRIQIRKLDQQNEELRAIRDSLSSGWYWYVTY